MTNVIGTPAPNPSTSSTPVHTVFCDLDGVVWLAKEPIAGAADAVARLRESGCRVLFVTNNSADLIATHEDALDTIGIPAGGAVISSAQAAATLVEPGERVLALAGPGVIEALTARGALMVDAGPCDAVVVGLLRTFDYDGLSLAATAVRRGARLIGTNDDATFPTPAGPIPGAGSLLAAVVTASGAIPEIAGKPYAPMVRLARRVIAAGDDPDDEDRSSGMLVVGDRPSTDGAFAAALGCGFALVRTGVTPPDASSAWEGAERAPGSGGHLDVVLDVADLAAVADSVVAARRRPA